MVRVYTFSNIGHYQFIGCYSLLITVIGNIFFCVFFNKSIQRMRGDSNAFFHGFLLKAI